MSNDTKLLVPALGPLYEKAGPYVLPMVRLAAGLLLIPHGASKFAYGLDGFAGYLGSLGYAPPLMWAWALALTETVGGALLALGLLTRPAALAIFIFMVNAVLHHLPNGYKWTEGGFEYPLLWGLLALMFFIRGGGKCSLDESLGKEF